MRAYIKCTAWYVTPQPMYTEGVEAQSKWYFMMPVFIYTERLSRQNVTPQNTLQKRNLEFSKHFRAGGVHNAGEKVRL